MDVGAGDATGVGGEDDGRVHLAELGQPLRRELGVHEEATGAHGEHVSPVADDESVPAFVIFTDSTLTAIASDKPSDARGLLAIPGIGRTKLDRYGDDLLAQLDAVDPA